MESNSDPNKNKMGFKDNLFMELKKVKRGQKKPDGIFGSFMTRPVSHIAAYFFKRIHFSPNIVTLLSFILCLFACLMLLMFDINYGVFVAAALFWWLAAVLDAADGDLARYININSAFGAWFDSYLDRLKEFIIFGTLSYLAFKGYGMRSWGNIFSNVYGPDLYLFLGFFAILSNVMSGWITDTKKAFCGNERKIEVKLSERFSLGMVDTRDFFVILSLLTGEFRIAIYVYGLLFPVILAMQTGLFLKRYS